MYSTFLTASPGSVLFSRSTLLKRKDLCFSCLRLGLIRHRRSLRSSHLFSSGLLISILFKCFRCSNESNQKAIRDRSSKVETHVCLTHSLRCATWCKHSENSSKPMSTYARCKGWRFSSSLLCFCVLLFCTHDLGHRIVFPAVFLVIVLPIWSLAFPSRPHILVIATSSLRPHTLVA
jgi:hypothetical protein